MGHRASGWALLVVFVLSGAGCGDGTPEDLEMLSSLDGALVRSLTVSVPAPYVIGTCAVVTLEPACMDHGGPRACALSELLSEAAAGCESRWWLRSPWLDVGATDPPRFVFKDAAVEQAIKAAVCGEAQP